MFASSSKDGFVKVWNANHPATVRYSANVKEYGWEFTIFSKFNKSDTLLLVSGSVLCDGEIIVFTIHDKFTVLSRVLTHPFSIFGAWYNDTYFLSAYGSLIWMNRVCTETNTSDTDAIDAKLFRFSNGSSVRLIMVADCLSTESYIRDDTSELKTVSQMKNVSSIRGNSPLHDVLADSAEGLSLDKMGLTQQISHLNHTNGVQKIHDEDLLDRMEGLKLNASLQLQKNTHQHQDEDLIDGSLILPGNNWKDDDSSSGMDLKSCASSDLSEIYNNQPVSSSSSLHSQLTCSALTKQGHSISVEQDEGKFFDRNDKYLIFATGSELDTAHQIGIKRIKPFRFMDKVPPPPTTPLEQLSMGQCLQRGNSSLKYVDRASVTDTFDDKDHLIDMHGQIIGMAVSPDQRYLYVNCRAWPKNCVIDDPSQPPPISQEIKIHVIDLVSLKKVGTSFGSHKAFTQNHDCFYLFLDVCDDYVASGSEDKQGYLWDRHYGCCVARFPHSNVVNSVAFNPADPEMLVTASDDFTLKIWRSKNRANEMKARSQN